MSEDLKTTPLNAFHHELGARMVPFAGYELPVQYPLGVMKEHIHTREAAGLFDVSHMGQVVLRPRTGSVEDVALALEALVPVNVVGVKPGRQRYGFFTDHNGCILDDLMISNWDDHLMVVVNGACKDADLAHMRAHLSDACEIELLDRALLALQGPEAETALERIVPGVADMKFMDVRALSYDGARVFVSRSGYTGEDGFEISVAVDQAEAFARALIAMAEVEPIGLGARDSLRLEAGLCLYGNDIDTTTTPIEAALEWAIQPARRQGGVRPGGFAGADVILKEMEEGAARRRVGILPEGRAPIREGTELFATEDGEAIGKITSGGFGPSVNAPVAMGYVPIDLAAPDTKILAKLRGKFVPVRVARMPFIQQTYKR